MKLSKSVIQGGSFLHNSLCTVRILELNTGLSRISIVPCTWVLLLWTQSLLHASVIPPSPPLPRPFLPPSPLSKSRLWVFNCLTTYLVKKNIFSKLSSSLSIKNNVTNYFLLPMGSQPMLHLSLVSSSFKSAMSLWLCLHQDCYGTGPSGYMTFHFTCIIPF